MPIYEIAIQRIKPEHAEAYPEVRRAFLAELDKQSGNEKDWTLRSFFTMPEPDDAEVLVGITRWSSQDDFNTANAALGSTELAGSLFSKVDMKAFVQVRTADGEPFALESVFEGGDNVLEVAVRRPKDGVSEADYAAARDAFFGEVAKQDGYRFDREFVDDDGNRVVLIGWDSLSSFQAALGALQGTPQMGAFFSIIDVTAYQAAQLQ